jgi:hypothetical protein
MKRVYNIVYDLAVKDKQCFVCSYYQIDKNGKDYCQKLKIADPTEFTIEQNYFLGSKIESKCKSKFFTPVEKVLFGK